MSVLNTSTIGSVISHILPGLFGGQIQGYGPVQPYRHDSGVCQITDHEFQFTYELYPEIMDWLTSDCVWQYYGYTGRDVYDQERAVVIFADVRGSIEFKLRFVDGQRIA
jgi:hypothetical protein